MTKDLAGGILTKQQHHDGCLGDAAEHGLGLHGHAQRSPSLIQLRRSLATFSGSLALIELTLRARTGRRRPSAFCADASSCASISLSRSATVRSGWPGPASAIAC